MVTSSKKPNPVCFCTLLHFVNLLMMSDLLAADVATQLYPHQKKALTFLLEREREKVGSDGNYSSLWQKRQHPLSRQISWFHIVTQKEIFEEPREAKGSILADDVCVKFNSWTRKVSHTKSVDGTREDNHLRFPHCRNARRFICFCSISP